MTLLVSWIGMDSKKDGLKASSIYFASDSRISWKGLGQFDYGRKVFGCNNWPDVFGYCGDVLFPSIVLNQVIELADSGLLFQQGWTSEQKFQAAFDKTVQSFNSYPKEITSITDDTLEIVHASREGRHDFFCRKMKWTRATNKWKAEDAKFSTTSDKLFVIGSGDKDFLEKYDRQWNAKNTRTSRAIFHAFCDTLDDIRVDRRCGGPPQLIGLFRKDNAIKFGVIKGGRRYFNGIEVTNLTNFNSIVWRNELFEVCDGETMKVKLEAQRQPNAIKH
jgi:hypothetical protein